MSNFELINLVNYDRNVNMASSWNKKYVNERKKNNRISSNFKL